MSGLNLQMNIFISVSAMRKKKGGGGGSGEKHERVIIYPATQLWASRPNQIYGR